MTLDRGMRNPRPGLPAMAPAMLRALPVGRRLALRLPASWRGHEALLTPRLRQLETGPALQPWRLRALRWRDMAEMVDRAAFHRAPGPDHLAPWTAAGLASGLSGLPGDASVPARPCKSAGS